jgi:hypothetical protein
MKEQLATLDLDIIRSNVCHRVRDMGELDFVLDTLQSEIIFHYWNENKQFQALYLLAMIDYVCRKNDVPLCENYNELRSFCFKKPIYTRDVLLSSKLIPDKDLKEEARNNSIPEFIRFNIVECDIEVS